MKLEVDDLFSRLSYRETVCSGGTGRCVVLETDVRSARGCGGRCNWTPPQQFFP
jgi:hypothetical protein